jgi:hypothetical protein
MKPGVPAQRGISHQYWISLLLFGSYTEWKPVKP